MAHTMLKQTQTQTGGPAVAHPILLPFNCPCFCSGPCMFSGWKEKDILCVLPSSALAPVFPVVLKSYPLATCSFCAARRVHTQWPAAPVFFCLARAMLHTNTEEHVRPATWHEEARRAGEMR